MENPCYADPLLIVVAMRLEMRAVLRGLKRARRLRRSGPGMWEAWLGKQRVVCVAGGMGRERARRAVASYEGRARAVWSLGFGGGLAPGVAEGELVVAENIVWEDGGEVRSYSVDRRSQELFSAVARQCVRKAYRGRVYSAAAPLVNAEEKMRAGRRFGAIAVEMEGRGIVEEAARRGMPTAMMRVVLDPLERNLEGIPISLGTASAASLMAAARPGNWVALARLAAAARRISPILTAVVASIGETQDWPAGYLPS